MKLIEALKQIKDLQRKAGDLMEKIATHCVISSIETPMYPDQKKQVSEWLQSRSDIIKEILRLRIGIQKTNLETKVTIELGGKNVTKTIAEWIHRRRDLAVLEGAAWGELGDRGIREGKGAGPSGQDIDIKIIRFYDPEERDRMKEIFASEPTTIDSRLEVVNAVTDLIE